jgi:T4 RnlA family RNA ligase
MNYEFPTITNISDVLPAIAGRDEFVVAEKEGYTVINYNVMMADTFPDVYSGAGVSGCVFKNGQWYNEAAAIRRECRGIIFDSKTGEILRRPFHKFFNVNEREETQDHVVDLSQDHRILEKLDGSMIAPFIVNGEMIWGTKMGATDVAKPVEEFVEVNSHYRIFAKFLISRGYTPIFEWCSRKQRIVLDYQEDQLILTAIRSLYDGRYVSRDLMVMHAEEYGIPVVRAFEPQTDMKAFLEYVRDLEDLEGFVVRFDDGHMLKLKCHWYLQIHKAKEAILQDRNIVELILEEHLDDIKAHLPAEDRFELSRFEHLFNIEVYGQAQLISNMLEHIRDENIDRKTFALEIGPKFDQYTRATIFKCWDETDDHKIIDAVKNVIRNNLSKNAKYDEIRSAWFNGVKYND